MWVESYLANHPPLPADKIRDAVMAKKPFITENGETCFFIEELKSWLASRGEKLQMQRLGSKLQRINIQSKRVNYKSTIGGRMQARVWVIPSEVTTSEAEGGDDNDRDE
jgi:hypothetical protein